MANKRRTARKSKKRANKQRSKKSTHGTRHVASGSMALARQICSVTDPFCPAARGSKWPDTTSAKTLAWCTEGFVTLTTDSSGRAGVFFGSDPNQAICSVTTFGGAYGESAIVVSTPAELPGWASFGILNSCQFRLVSMGIHVRSIMSSMNNQGSVGILTIPGSSVYTYIIGTDPGTTLFEENTRISCNQGDLCCVPHNDGINSKRFVSAQGTPMPDHIFTNGNDLPYVYVSGGPASTAAVQVKFIYHYELLFTSGTVFNTLATPAAVQNDLITTGKNFVQSRINSVVKGGIKEVERQTMGAAEAFGRKMIQGAAGAIGGAIGGYFGGPNAGMAGAQIGYGGMGMIMDVD